MHRRQFLASLTAAAGVAGCLRGSTGSTTDDPSTATGTDTADGSPGTVTLRAAYRYGVNDDGIGVAPPDRDQFAFLRPPDDAAGSPPGAFALELDGRRFEPESSMPGFAPWTPGVEGVYTEDSRSGALVFDVPTVDAVAGSLVHDGLDRPLRHGRAHPLDDGDVPAFAEAPELSLRSVSIPETVWPGDPLELTVEAANEGDRTGLFLAGFRTGGLPKTVDVSVDPGETATESVSFPTPDDGGSSMHFAFSYPGGQERYEVAVEDEENSTA